MSFRILWVSVWMWWKSFKVHDCYSNIYINSNKTLRLSWFQYRLNLKP